MSQMNLVKTNTADTTSIKYTGLPDVDLDVSNGTSRIVYTVDTTPVEAPGLKAIALPSGTHISYTGAHADK